MKIKKIQYSSRFLRAFKTFKFTALKEVIRARIAIFEEDCFDPRLKTHKLKGSHHGEWSFSITESHRILFVFHEENTVELLDVDDHDIYR